MHIKAFWIIACVSTISCAGAASMSNVVEPTADPTGENDNLPDMSSESSYPDINGSDCLGVDALHMEACDAAQWVLCSDATCEDEPVEVDGTLVVKCTCNIEDNGTSIIPASGSGAVCLTGLPGGDEMCAEMNNGSLYSSFGSDSSNPMPAAAVAECPPGTEWGYCWGAQCTVSPTNSSEAICDCPLITADMQSMTNGVVVSVTASSCTDSSVCDKMWNSGAALMYDIMQQFTGPLPYCYDYQNETSS